MYVYICIYIYTYVDIYIYIYIYIYIVYISHIWHISMSSQPDHQPNIPAPAPPYVLRVSLSGNQGSVFLKERPKPFVSCLLDMPLEKSFQHLGAETSHGFQQKWGSRRVGTHERLNVLTCFNHQTQVRWNHTWCYTVNGGAAVPNRSSLVLTTTQRFWTSVGFMGMK